MPEQRQKAPRGRNVVEHKARKSEDWLQAGFSDFFEEAERYNPPEGEVVPSAEAVFDTAIAGAVQTHGRRSRAMYGQHYDRKEAAREEREQRWVENDEPARAAASGLTKDVKAEEADALKAQAEAAIAQATPEELAALQDAIIERQVDQAPEGSFTYPDIEEDEEPAEQSEQYAPGYFDPREQMIRASAMEAEAEKLLEQDEAAGLLTPDFLGDESNSEEGDE
jgi:hypothetical protein